MRQILVGAIVLSISLALIACGDDESGDSGTSSPEASASPTAVPLPAGFPSPEGATIESGINEAGLKVLTLTTIESVEAMATFYEDELSGPPWEATARTDLPDQNAVVITFTNTEDPRQGGTMTIVRDSLDTSTIITITFITAATTPIPTEPPDASPTP